VSFDPSQGLIVVPARLHGPNGDVIARLALDTGATGTMVNWDLLVLIGYDPAAIQERIQVTTGSGVEYVPRVPVKRIECLDAQRQGFPVLCHTLPPTAMVDGLLGLDYLRGSRLEVDFANGTIDVDAQA
jgi:predicted aspartyl protease